MKVNLFTYRYILFFSLCLTISYFLGAKSINLELVAVISISPLFLVTNIGKIDVNDFLLFIMLLMMLVSGQLHGDFRWSSYLFSVCFVTSFIYLKGEINKGYFPLKHISSLLKFLIYLYTTVLVVQQICVLSGLTPILANNYDSVFKWKLSSLSPEPSHLAIFIFIMMYSRVLLYELEKGTKYTIKEAHNEKYLWIAYFWCMLGSGSTSGLIYTFLIFLRYVNWKTIIVYVALFGLLLMVISYYFSESESIIRAGNLGSALITMDGERFLNADHSAAMRFSPMVYFFNHLEFWNIDFWFGHGMDYGKKIFNIYMFNLSGDGTYNEFEGVNMGGFWGFILDYGLIPFIILVCYLSSIMTKIRDKWFVIIYGVLMMFIGLNMQMFWFATVLALIVSKNSQIQSSMHRKNKIIVSKNKM